MIGDVLKYVRKEKKLSQKDLASKIQVDQTTLSGWERGYREPNFDDIAKLLKLCNYDIVFRSKETNQELDILNDLEKDWTSYN